MIEAVFLVAGGGFAQANKLQQHFVVLRLREQVKRLDARQLERMTADL